MICHKCGKEIPQESLFCNFCGSSVLIEEAADTIAAEEEASEIVSESVIEIADHKPTKKSNKYKIITIAAVILSLIVVGGLGYFYAVPYYKYANAKSLLKNKEYEKAILAFTGMKDYRDSSELILESNYQYAKDMMDKKKFSDAMVRLNTLPTYYKDTSDLLIENKYLFGKSDLENKKYADAVAFFTELAAYKDSAKLLIQANYFLGKQLLNEHEYADAVKKLTEAANYKDSKKLIAEAKYELGKSYIHQNNFSAGIENYESIKGYKDVNNLLIQAYYLEAFRQSEIGNLGLAEQLFEKSGNYRDSKKHLSDISVMNKYQGTWEDKFGFVQIVFAGMKLAKVYFPYESDSSVHTWQVTLRNGKLSSGLSDTYYIKNNKLIGQNQTNGDVTEYKKISDSRLIPTETEKVAPAIGMTADAVEKSYWGRPLKVNKTTSKSGISEQWVYSLDKYIYLEDGIVIAIQE